MLHRRRRVTFHEDVDESLRRVHLDRQFARQATRQPAGQISINIRPSAVEITSAKIRRSPERIPFASKFLRVSTSLLSFFFSIFESLIFNEIHGGSR